MKKIILLANVLTVPALAASETPSFFIGVKGGYQRALDDGYKHSNPEGTTFGLYSGFQFSPSWSWDIGYQYHDKLNADATSVDIDTWLIESALGYDWYLQDDLSVYGRLGAAYWNMEKTQSAAIKFDATGLSPLGEIGVNYSFSPNVRLSAGYQYIDGIGKESTGEYDSHGLLLSFTYTFGSSEQPTLVQEISSRPNKTDIVNESPKPKLLTFPSTTTDGFFSFDSVELSHDLIKQLTEITSVLNSYPQARATVVGHTDSTGPEPYNQKLSERRAQAVINKLIELEVAPEQLEWRGEGESQPIADNNTADGRAKNRRVEIIIPDFQFQE